MPFLMVNLDDQADCRQAIQQLRERIRPRGAMRRGGGVGRAGVAALPLGQKLRRMQQRGLWRHLVAIARASDEARSLTEWDGAIGLPANKMRSLKAIMAKLENRFGLRFLESDADAGQDAAGNPRYRMVPRVRTVILRIAGEAAVD